MKFTTIAEVLPTLLNFYYKYGGVFKLRVGPIRYTVILCEPKSIGFILGSPKYVEKSNDYEFIKAWLGAGLLTSPSNVFNKVMNHSYIIISYIFSFRPAMEKSEENSHTYFSL